MPESVAILKKENQALKAEIDALSKTVNQLQAKVDQDASSGAKVVGLPEVDVRESAQQTSSLCVSLFRALGADVSITDIDTAHRVLTRQESGGPRLVICN